MQNGSTIGGTVEQTEAGYVGHVLIRPNMPPFLTLGPFRRHEEAVEALRDYWRQREREQHELLEERLRENARRRAAFAAEVTSRRSKARSRLERSNASRVRVGGFVYERHEFGKPLVRAEPRRRESRPTRRVRTASTARGDPALGDDDDPHDDLTARPHRAVGGWSR